MTGKKVPHDFRKGFMYYKRSAALGHPYSTYKLGFCYLNSLGTKYQPSKAIDWYKKALQFDIPLAKNDLGYCYERGVGVEKDEKKAFHLYYDAFQSGSPHGAYNVARCYLTGVGIPRNPSLSFQTYQRAVQLGNRPRALIGLAECYQSGIGIDVDLKMAFKYYLLAAEQGDLEAEVAVARYYLYGSGIPSQWNEAYNWFKKALFHCTDDSVCARFESLPEMKAKLLSEEWPKSNYMLDQKCQSIIIEYLLCAQVKFVIAEVQSLIVGSIISIWPRDHSPISTLRELWRET